MAFRSSAVTSACVLVLLAGCATYEARYQDADGTSYEVTENVGPWTERIGTSDWSYSWDGVGGGRVAQGQSANTDTTETPDWLPALIATIIQLRQSGGLPALEGAR
jgi:hypothetical protein